jgi:hypothetical protein
MDKTDFSIDKSRIEIHGIRCLVSHFKHRALSNMEFLPLAAGTAAGNVDDRTLELLSKFVDLLGSSSGHLSWKGDDREDLKQCLSSTLKDKDIVCILPTFHVLEQEAQIHEHIEKSPSVFWNEFERGFRSMIQIPLKGETNIKAQPCEEQKQSLGLYTRSSIDSAPLNLLRKLQDVLRFFICTRLNEWKVLLQRHSSNEAKELAKLLTYQNMIKGCRGNTIMSIVGFFENFQRDDIDSSSYVYTKESASCNTHLSALPVACRLQANLFVKLRHNPRTFETSSFTLAFETTGFVRCEWDISSEFDNF